MSDSRINYCPLCCIIITGQRYFNIIAGFVFLDCSSSYGHQSHGVAGDGIPAAAADQRAAAGSGLQGAACVLWNGVRFLINTKLIWQTSFRISMRWWLNRLAIKMAMISVWITQHRCKPMISLCLCVFSGAAPSISENAGTAASWAGETAAVTRERWEPGGQTAACSGSQGSGGAETLQQQQTRSELVILLNH